MNAEAKIVMSAVEGRTSDLKVLCVCGSEMENRVRRIAGTYTWHADYKCECGWQSPCKCGSTPQEAIAAAYAAATATPPNRPLTREQVEAMPGLAAVWVWVEGRYKPTIMTAERAMLRFQGDRVLSFHKDTLLFAAPPTPADIEAARKERTE